MEKESNIYIPKMVSLGNRLIIVSLIKKYVAKKGSQFGVRDNGTALNIWSLM